MLNKYTTHLEEMCQKIKNGGSPLKVIGEYAPIFEKDGIGILGIANYLGEYLQRTNC